MKGGGRVYSFHGKRGSEPERPPEKGPGDYSFRGGHDQEGRGKRYGGSCLT